MVDLYTHASTGQTVVDFASSTSGTSLVFSYQEASASVQSYATRGSAFIDSITSNQIVGHMAVSTSDDYTAIGDFTVAICN